MRNFVLVTGMLHFALFLQAQQQPVKQTSAHFSGIITATNNGISLLPNFTLNKPAVLFDLSVGKNKLSFDPMFRFAMDGKPWTFVFWWRYKLATSKRFTMSVGAHPAFVFRTVNDSLNGVAREYMSVQRYFAGETTPTLLLGKRAGLGMHYLYSHGLTKDITQHTHFIALRGLFTNLPLAKKLALTLIPQFYFLKMDKREGTYVNATAILGIQKFPLSISSIVSRAIHTDIAGKELVWNVGINYNFNKKFTRSQ